MSIKSIYPDVTKEGVCAHKFKSANIDVNGKWGGHKSLIARYEPNDSENNDVLYLYMLVGGYHEIGRYGDDKKATIYGLYKELGNVIRSGVSMELLMSTLKSLVNKER